MAAGEQQEQQDAAASADDRIDALLARYLALLDDYARLRDTLGGLQAGLYHDLARANFAAERGVRYGRDFYDERMQALARLRVAAPAAEGQAPSFTVVETAAPGAGEAVAGGGGGGGGGREEEEEEAGEGAAAAATAAAAAAAAQEPRDPLRWFGILTPQPLRSAQARARGAVEVVARLASLSAEMAAVELQVRRLRKKRAKAAALAGREEERQRQALALAAPAGRGRAAT